MSDEFEDLRANHAHAIANLTATQERCTALLEEARMLRAQLTLPDGLSVVLRDVVMERRAQDQKWGPLDAGKLAIEDGTGGPLSLILREAAREVCKAAGDATAPHALVLLEEVFEALAETESGPLRAELIQICAVCAKWVEILDRRASAIAT